MWEPAGSVWYNSPLALKSDTSNPVLRMPDMQVCSLGLDSKAKPPQPDGAQEPVELSTRRWALHHTASDVPQSLALLIEFLHDRAVPLPLR